jgi:hypothetical protein
MFVRKRAGGKRGRTKGGGGKRKREYQKEMREGGREGEGEKEGDGEEEGKGEGQRKRARNGGRERPGRLRWSRYYCMRP